MKSTRPVLARSGSRLLWRPARPDDAISGGFDDTHTLQSRVCSRPTHSRRHIRARGRESRLRLPGAERPTGTRSFALIVDDPDAPAGTFVHWVIYNIPASSNGLPEVGIGHGDAARWQPGRLQFGEPHGLQRSMPTFGNASVLLQAVCARFCPRSGLGGEQRSFAEGHARAYCRAGRADGDGLRSKRPETFVRGTGQSPPKVGDCFPGTAPRTSRFANGERGEVDADAAGGRSGFVALSVQLRASRLFTTGGQYNLCQ